MYKLYSVPFQETQININIVKAIQIKMRLFIIIYALAKLIILNAAKEEA